MLKYRNDKKRFRLKKFADPVLTILCAGTPALMKANAEVDSAILKGREGFRHPPYRVRRRYAALLRYPKSRRLAA